MSRWCLRTITPCIGVCRIDSPTDLCIGCKRTRAEIGRWSQLTDDQRNDIMKLLCDRRANDEQSMFK